MRGAKLVNQANLLSRSGVTAQLLIAALALTSATACGSKATESADASADDATTGDDAQTEDAVAGDVAGYDSIAVDLSKVEAKDLALPPIKVNEAGQQYESAVRALKVQPLDCSAAKPCPLVFVIGDYDAPAFPTLSEPAKKLAAISHVSVILVNLPGTGTGGQHSSGTNDYGALWHITTIKELYKLQSIAAGVDKTKVGFLTIGTGIVPVAGAFYAFPSDLASVNFVIDVEGPTDRCAMSQAPEDDKKNIGPGDGAGATDSACHFAVAPHSAQYPPAQGAKPASIVCAPGAWPITETGKGCDENQWWVDREPYGKLQKLTARYQRIQFKYDHRLPSHWASRMAMKAVAASPSNFFMLNDMPGANGKPGCGTINEDDCTALEANGQSCWLSGPYGNGLPPAPYAGADFQPISWDALFAEVLPDYVARVLNTTDFPKCK